MAIKYKIIEESLVDSFELVAIHADLESYALAYQLNKTANLKLGRTSKDLELEKGSFPIFEWQDEAAGQQWQLLSNTAQYEDSERSIGLFPQTIALRNCYLVDERKEVDYFLKVSPGNARLTKNVVKAVKLIPQLTMVYTVDTETIKSTQNLIFY